MIYIERTITIKKNQAKIKEPIVLYKGDMNIELQFTIENNPFKYKPGMDVTYGQLIIKRPNAEPIFSEPAKMSSSRVLFIVTGDMIDGLDVDGNYTDEMGAYDFQIQLLNTDQTSRGSLPPVTGGIIIKEPLCEPAAASRAAVNSRSTFVMRANNDNDELFDIGGNYMKTTWVSGDIITDTKLNRVEEALYQINDSVPTDYTTERYVDLAIVDVEHYVDSSINMESREIRKYVDDYYASRNYVDNTIRNSNATNKNYVNDAIKNSNAENKSYVDSTIANHDIINRNYTDNAINNAGFATELYVDQQINNIEIPESDLSDYAKVEYVDAAIANVELIPGPQGEPGPQGPQGPAGKDADAVDLTGYAKVEYVDNAIANIEVSGAGGINIMTIGNGVDEYIFTGNEFTEEEYTSYTCKSVLLDKVTIKFIDPEYGEERTVTYKNQLVYIELNGNKLFTITSLSGNDSNIDKAQYLIDDYGIITRMYYEQYIGKSYINHISFATKEDLDNALGDIESLLGGI